VAAALWLHGGGKVVVLNLVFSPKPAIFYTYQFNHIRRNKLFILWEQHILAPPSCGPSMVLAVLYVSISFA